MQRGLAFETPGQRLPASPNLPALYIPRTDHPPVPYLVHVLHNSIHAFPC